MLSSLAAGDGRGWSRAGNEAQEWVSAAWQQSRAPLLCLPSARSQCRLSPPASSFTNIALTRPPPTVTMIRTGLMEEHQSMAANQRFQQQMANRPSLQAMSPANRLKKQQSLQQRLGRPNVKARLNLAMVNQGRGGPILRGRGNRRPTRALRGGFVQRGAPNTFVPRGGRSRGQGPLVKQMSGGGMMQSLNTFSNAGQMQTGGRTRGRGRGFRGNRGGFVASYRGSRGGTRGGRGMRGGGRPGARGRGGRGAGRGRGGGNVSREDLDSQLDEYMAKTRTQLDAELDTYMQQSI